MTQIPDFTETELWIVRSTLRERYGCEVEPSIADVETRIDTASGEIAWCPALCWTRKGANFVLFKLAPKRFRAIFYYHPGYQVGTGHEFYDEIGDCIVSVLQVESDHMRKQKMKYDDRPASAADPQGDDSPTHSPLFLEK